MKGNNKERSKIVAKDTDNPNELIQIKEYHESVNHDLLAFVEQIKNLHDSNIASKLNYQLHFVSSREEADIKVLIGIDVKGFKHNINGGSVNHINTRHGINGLADSSMRFSEDIARMEYVLENYDNITVLQGVSKIWANADQSAAQVIRYEKKINGTYYVVEAVPDSKLKKLQIESAYMSNKKEVPQQVTMDKSHGHTSETLAASTSFDENLS